MLRHLLKRVPKNHRNHNQYNITKHLHTIPARLGEEHSQEKEQKHLDKINEVLSKYDKEKEEKILKIINNYNTKDLLSYEISKGRAIKLLAWRLRNGSLKNLKDIFSIETFGLKVADKFFQSLLAEPKSKELNLGKAPGRVAPFVSPSIEDEQRQSIKSTVAVRIGVNSITWARLDVPPSDTNAPCLLTHWQHHEISEKKLHMNELIQRCLYVHHLIPIADCYLFENPQMANVSNNAGSKEQQNINIQKAQVGAIMGYALASRNSPFNSVLDSESDEKFHHLPSVFYIRRFLTARLFNHLVGTERISSEQTILTMMRTFYNTNEEQDFIQTHQDPGLEAFQQLDDSKVNLSSCVQFPMELRQMFSNVPRYYREFLGQALLLNLAFVRLVLLQDAECIATVSRGNKAKPLLNGEA